MAIEQTREWEIARRVLEPVHARRTGISHFQHVREGVRILQTLSAPLISQQAFTLHPLIQKTDDFVNNLALLEGCDARAVALAVEYRWVANQGVRQRVRENGWQITLSSFPAVNQMLLADKVQNRKDFLLHFPPSHPDFDELVRYFGCWMEALGVSEERYRELAASAQKAVD